MRVAVLKQLWKRADPSPGRRLRRHAFYQRLAAHAPDLWARCVQCQLAEDESDEDEEGDVDDGGKVSASA